MSGTSISTSVCLCIYRCIHTHHLSVYKRIIYHICKTDRHNVAHSDQFENVRHLLCAACTKQEGKLAAANVRPRGRSPN